MPHFPSLPLRFERASAPLEFQPQSQGPNVFVYPVRVITEIYVYVEGQPPKPREGLVDTGAPICVFPGGTWEDDWVRWLEPANDAARKSMAVRGVSSESQVPARLGLIDISVLGITSGAQRMMVESPQLTVVAKFIEAPAPFDPPRVLLGMNALEHWRALEVDFELPTARLLGTA